MIKKISRLAILAGLLAFAMVPGAIAIESDFAQDVAIESTPSPRDVRTGSSINQYGKGQSNSQIDNYIYQDEQVNLVPQSGTLRVLRTNQKALINQFVTELIELKNVNPRELRGLARTICRKEGGDADVLYDKVKKRNYMVVVCPPYLIPYLRKTLQGLDQEWVKEVKDGSWRFYYRAKNRDVRNIMRTLQVYRTPDAQWDFDDPANALLYYDQPCIAPLFTWGAENIDIPPSQLMMDIAIYEVDTQNDLHLGFDFESWKNGLGRDMFEFIFWNFKANDPLSLFPGSLPGQGVDWGRFRSYNFYVTTAYLDFLQIKGKARLLTKATLTAKSGTAAELSAIDQFSAFSSGPAAYTAKAAAGGVDKLDAEMPFRLSSMYEYYHRLDPNAYPMSLGELLNQPSDQVRSSLTTFLYSLKLSDAQVQTVLDEVAAHAEKNANKTVTKSDFDEIFLPRDVTLQVFRDRILQYRKAGETGVLMSIYPVVGQLSAEVALALDVTDVVGYGPSGTPIIEHRYFASNIEVKDGQPFILGGMKRTTEVNSANGVPYLRDIKWLGYLFGREIASKHEKELVVIATPQFKLCPTSEVAVPKEIQTSLNIANGKETLEVPRNAVGFDQWMLDKDKE